MKEIFVTDRLILKVLKERDAQIILDYYIRNREFLKAVEPERKEEFFKLSTQRLITKLEYKAMKNKTCFKLWIFIKDYKSYDKAIGCIALNNIIYGVFKSCFLGYKLDKDYINKGYMTEAVEKMAEIAFNDLNLHRIEANIMPKNKQSLKVVEKANFVNEGLAKNYLCINGKWEDHLRMTLINPRTGDGSLSD